MKKNKCRVIYANGKIIQLYWLVVAILSFIFIASATAAFIYGFFAVGILAIFALFLVWGAIGIILSNKQVAFYNDHFEIPKEYVTKDKLFSKTMIKYAGLKSVSYLMPDQVDDDCTGLHGGKVPCIKFTDDRGEVYRMKVEYFSEKQALAIIDQVKRYASIQ